MQIRTNKRGNTKVKFTAAEQEAMNREIEDQLLDLVARNLMEIEALMLVQLREQLGFGKKRLKRFYKNFSPNIYDMMVKQMASGEKSFVNIDRLKAYGCPVDDWVAEREAEYE